MKTSILFSALLQSLISTAFAAVSTFQSTSTIEATCITLLGSSSLATVGTAYHTEIVHSTAHLTSTSTPSTTIWPSTEATTTSSLTSMITVSVTEPYSTDYYTSFSTIYQTTTFTSNTNTTVTTVLPSTVYTTQTITIPTSPGFVPAASGKGYPGAKKRAANPALHNRFNLDARAAASTTLPLIRVQAGILLVSPSVYPTSVSCEYIFEAFTTLETILQATSTATITAPPFTATVFTTSYITTTTTYIPPDVEITTIFVDEIAVSTTTTLTQTYSSTVVDIVTIAAPSATYYAACASNNLVGTVNGATFNALQVSGTVQPRYYYSYEATAYDCCVVCMQTENCAGASYADGTCSVYPIGGTAGTSGGTCNPAVFIGDYFEYSGLGDPELVINGPCGQFAYGQGACYTDNGGFC
jgi:hypothetical protein